MTSLNLKDETCVSGLKLLGDYWTLRIIDALSTGEQHFCELQRNVDNLNPVTLTDRLKKLEDANLISRSEESKTKVIYTLSILGTEIMPVIKAINVFSTKIIQTSKI